MRRASACGLVLLGLATGASAQGEEPGEARAAGEPEELEPDARLEAPVSAQGAAPAGALTAEIRALAAEGGELARVETIGVSEGGRAIDVLVLGDAQAAAREGWPALLLVNASGAGATDAGSAVLGVARHLLDAARADPAASPLARSLVHVAPELDPDRVGGDGAVRFERNFPLGWLPASMRPGAGDYPLSSAATLGCASWLSAREDVALVVAFGAEEPARSPATRGQPDGTQSAALDELLASLPAEVAARLDPWPPERVPVGGLLDYAAGALDLSCSTWLSPAGGAEDTGKSGSVEAAAAVVELLERLPRLEFEKGEVGELAPGLWRVDLGLVNRSPLSTRGGARAPRPEAFRLELTGGRLVAGAIRGSSDGPFRVLDLRSDDEGTRFDAPALGGGEVRWLRLILEGESAASLQVAVRGARAGTARIVLTLG